MKLRVQTAYSKLQCVQDDTMLSVMIQLYEKRGSVKFNL